jgi:hypothetical protein
VTQKLLLDRRDRGAKLKVKAADQNKFLVSKKWEVNLDRYNFCCSCNEFLHTGLPCEHMAAAVMSVDGNLDRELYGTRNVLNFSDYVNKVYSQA